MTLLQCVHMILLTSFLYITAMAASNLKGMLSWSPHYFDFISQSLEKAMAPHSSTLAWKIPWMEEPGRLQSMGSLRVGHD